MLPIDFPPAGRGNNPEALQLTPGAYEVPEAPAPAATPATASPPTSPRPVLLIKFTHGLGDCVQLQVVLRHLRECWPDWDVDVLIGRGKGAAVRGLCRAVFEEGAGDPPAGPYDRVENLGWYENYNRDPSLPQTKPTNCLKEVFGITPRLELFRYSFTPTEEQQLAAREYLASVSVGGRRKVLILHYQGNTSETRKNLPHEVAAATCTFARRCGWCVVILDWDGRTPLVDNRHVFNPGAAHPMWGGTGTGDAGMVAALIQQADLFIGVDSGPLHVAVGCPQAPAIGVWLEHSPVQFCDLGEHVTHLVPEDWRQRPPVNGDGEVSAFMAGRYVLREYPTAEGLHSGANMGLVELLASKMRVPELENERLASFTDKLRANFHPEDLPRFVWWLSYYHGLHRIAESLKPRQILEIGVRAGYSGLTFLDAVPNCEVTGIDFYGDEQAVNTHGGKRRFQEHARKILPEDRYTLEIIDTATLLELPPADLVYIDGDHTREGCLRDLRLAAAAARKAILVDDYDSISSVREACDQFANESPGWHSWQLDNYHSGFMLFERVQQYEELIHRRDFLVRPGNIRQDLEIIIDVFERDTYQTKHFPSNVDPEEVVVDIGAHIGAFARLWHRKNPQATIVCVEVCPENLPALRSNVSAFAKVRQAACTYEIGPMALLNACFSNCESTGGSTVVLDTVEPLLAPQDRGRYLEDRRPIVKVTLEEIMASLQVDKIDLLKLDCEGSEYSILQHSPAVHDGRVRAIVGEYHGVARWNEFRARVLPGWDYGHMFESGECGIFHLRSPHSAPTTAPVSALQCPST